MTSKQSSSSSRKRLLKWLDSFSKVSAAVEQHGDLIDRLEAGGGITKIENFLPAFVADGILELLEGMSEAQWNVSVVWQQRLLVTFHSSHNTPLSRATPTPTPTGDSRV